MYLKSIAEDSQAMNFLNAPCITGPFVDDLPNQSLGWN